MKETRSFILDLYPTTKFILTLSIAVISLILPGYIYSYIVPVLFLLIALITKKTNLYINIVLKGFIPIIVMIFLLQSFFYPGETILWSWKIFSIKEEGIMFSLNLTSKIIAIGSALILFFQITKINDLVRSLEIMGVSPKFTYVFTSAINIIPELRQQLTRIMEAQKSRGVETEGGLSVRMKAFFPALTPLILASFSSTEEKAITLESRAFTVRTKKTSLHHIEKTRKDTITRMIVLLLIISAIIWRVL